MKKKILWAVGGLLLAAVAAVGICSAVNGYFVLMPPVQLMLSGEAAVEVDAFANYTDAGVIARKGKTDLASEVVVENPVDTTKPGSYTVTYTLTVRDKTYTQSRAVTVVDREAPQLELLGEKEMKIPARKFYEEPGYTAQDRCDGDLTERVVVSEAMEGEILTLTYTVTDAAGNENSVQRVITVRDEVAPTIRLKGYSTIYVACGGKFKDPGCRAEDDVDGDLSGAVKCSGSVDTGKEGTYTLTYRVSDSSGNAAEVTRKVKVYTYAPSGGDRVYLTFDDGPSGYITPQVLDILAANDVQATFFIVNYSSDTRYLVQRMINEGHTVAIHGYSHDYARIYANDEAFMDNIYRLQDKLMNDFGYNATIIRFPGGSSNTVSASYNDGIMTRLAARVQQEGFSYFDWNVSSGDASGTSPSASKIYHNVSDGLRRGRNNVVLMHDIGGKQTTVDALQAIIDYAKGNGYMLLPLTLDTSPVHHGIAN